MTKSSLTKYITRSTTALAGIIMVGAFVAGGFGFGQTASAAVTTAWSGWHTCSFNATAWENVRVLIETDSTGKKRPIQLSVQGDEHIDKINYVKENYSGGVSSTQVNHPEPNTGTWTTGNFSPQLPLVSGTKTWAVSLHRTNGTLLTSCASGPWSF